MQLIVPEAILIQIGLKMLRSYTAKCPVYPIGSIRSHLKKRSVSVNTEFLDNDSDVRLSGVDMLLDKIVTSQGSNSILDEMAVRNLFDFEMSDTCLCGDRSSQNQGLFLGMPENRRIVGTTVSSAIDPDKSGKQFLRIAGGHGVTYFVTDQPCGFVGGADHGSQAECADSFRAGMEKQGLEP